MSQIEEVNEQILSKLLKSDEFYEALWGKEEFTPNETIELPNDYNCGALANPLEYVYQFIREITEGELHDLEEPYIDIVVYFFTGLKRFPGEGNTDLVRRMESLLVREDEWRSERFGTPWDIMNVFSYYLDKSLLFYIPNHVVTDLLTNGDFEDPIGSEWTILPSGDRSTEDAFTGTYKLDFTGFDSAYQTVAVFGGAYILNCFVKPLAGPPEGFASMWEDSETAYQNASYSDQDFMLSSGGSAPVGELDVFNLVVQRDSDNKFYNIATEEWSVSGPTNTFTMEGDQYTLAEFFIVTDGNYNITIKFEKIVDFLLDHVEFGDKLYPAFELLYLDVGLAVGFSSMWEELGPFDNASFMDQDFMFSSATSNYTDTYYQELLDMVKASGIKGIWNREANG